MIDPTVMRLTQIIMDMPEDQRVALLASLQGERPRPTPVIAGEPRPLPEPCTAAEVTSRIEWV